MFGLNVPNQSWQREIEAAESYWLSPAAIQRCVSSYLASRLGNETENLLGEKTLKTLRLSQEARAILLEDFKKLPRSAENVSREWEKWLKGSQPILSVTFDQEVATETPTARHLSVLHPLVRQAASAMQRDEPVYASLTVRDDELLPGSHRFAIYRWKKQGVKLDEELVAVSDDPVIEKTVLRLLQSAEEKGDDQIPPHAAFEELDAQHHAKWAVAQGDHIAANSQQVEHRVQSLKVSHRARIQAIEHQIDRATNDKIRLMKVSELARANADFTLRNQELQQAASSGDIHATPVIFGTIAVVEKRNL